MITLSPNRGAFVTRYSRDKMRHIADLSWPITRLYLARAFERASDPTMEELVSAQGRVATYLEQGNPVGFALAMAAMTMKVARFGLGEPGEATLQVLYRPSIRYTIAGLEVEGGAKLAADAWGRHIYATKRRDSEAATKSALTMLRDIHLPILAREEGA